MISSHILSSVMLVRVNGIDSMKSRVKVTQKFDSNGNYITKWSVGSPAGIAIDQNGKAYVINQNTGGVEIYSLVSS